MRRIASAAIVCTLAISMRAAEFQNGQAAIAVIGQPSFSAREPGISPVALSISNGHLYVADAGKHLLAYDISDLPALGAAPVSVLNQSVIPGVSAVSMYGKSVAIADARNHRVLLWRDVTAPTAIQRPDLILSDSARLAEPISVALDGQRLFVGDATLHRVLVWNALPESDNQPPDVVLGAASDGPAANSISRPVALESDGQRLFVADSGYHRVLVFAAADIALTASAVVNAASLTAGLLAPGTLVNIAVSGFTTSGEAADDGSDAPLPHKLAGVEVLLDGVPLPLLSVTPTEIRAQLPYDLGGRTSLSIHVRSDSLNSNAVPINVISASPGLFAFPGKEPRSGMSFHEGTPLTSASPARPGDTITIWAAGLGPVASFTVASGVPNAERDAPVQIPVNAVINGLAAEVVSAELPQGSIGIYELQIVVPKTTRSVTNAPNSAALFISQNGQQSNTVTIPIAGGIQ
jgi:uncharacterized protein (TIGR03437 family)